MRTALALIIVAAALLAVGGSELNTLEAEEARIEHHR